MSREVLDTGYKGLDSLSLEGKAGVSQMQSYKEGIGDWQSRDPACINL